MTPSLRDRLTLGLSRLRPPWILRRYTGPNQIITIELRQRLPLAAFGLALAGYLAAPSGVGTMALAALAGLLLSAFLWARAMALRVRAQRRLHYAAVQVGDELEEVILLENASPLPVLWAEIVDRSDLPGYHVSSARAADARSALRWRAHAVCARRGLFRLGPWELHLGDPFGIFLVRQTYARPEELLVYPPLAPLPDRLLPHHAAVGDHRLLRQPLRAETLNASGTRLYQPGDSVRLLHWPTTARKGEPYAKQFEPEATSTVWLIPDFDRAAHLARGDDEAGLGSTEETMVVLAASLVEHLLRIRLSVGLIAAAQPGALSVLSPRQGQANLWHYLRALAPLHAECPWPFAQTLRRARPLISSRDLVIALTPSVSADWPQELRHLAGRSGSAEAIVFDPASFGGTEGAGGLAALLGEMGMLAQVVRRGEVRPLAGAYGTVRRWEFMTLGTGRAVARQTPRRAAAWPGSVRT